MTIFEALSKLRPGTTWNLRDCQIEQADDGAPRVTPPTWNEVMMLVKTEEYKDLRRAEYPYIGDQLDALWKGGEAALEMKAKIDAVKAKYPKPQ